MDAIATTETGRRVNDAYYTTPELARALVALLVRDGWWRGGWVLEPSAGKGAFVRAIGMTTPCAAQITSLDIDKDTADAIGRVPSHEIGGIPHRAKCGDFLDHLGRYTLILGNPPYSAAEAHVRHALILRDPQFGAVAFLLRLGFLESQQRAPLWREHPASKVYVLSERPSFTGGGTDNSAYGLFVWANWWTRPTELEVVSWK